jgi:hypothetical protein
MQTKILVSSRHFNWKIAFQQITRQKRERERERERERDRDREDWEVNRFQLSVKTSRKYVAEY